MAIARPCSDNLPRLRHHASRSEPYDPYVPRGSNPSTGPSRPGGPSKTAAIQAQIDDTVDIMKSNINKVAERGERLDDLQDKTGMHHSLLLMLSRSPVWHVPSIIDV